MKHSTIFINGRFLTKPVTGVQRYARELLREIDRQLPLGNLRIICLAPPEAFAPPRWENIELRQVGRSQGNLWEQVDLPRHAHGELIFSPANIGPFAYRNQVVTLHDASIFAVPQAYSWAFRAKYRFILRQLGQNARQIITDSRFSQKELAHYLKISHQRLRVVPLGADHLDDVAADTQILAQYNLEAKHYLLVVATQSLHKNLGAVFEALKALQQKIKLVVVGGRFEQVFKETVNGKMDSIVMPGYVSDGQLKAFYENALGLIFPSIYEGFGLPMLEAMRCGCPVLCSNAASMSEVAEEAALYFDPYRGTQMTRVIDYFLAASTLQERLKTAGQQQANKFKWSATAQQSIEILLQTISR